MASLVIPGRFCGPPGIANGGYVDGTLSALVASPAVTVRLRRPVPLDRKLDVHSGAVVELLDGDELLANAEPAELSLQVPDPPSAEEAAAAVAALPSWEADHRFPHCWGCGPERAPGDGLRTRVGPLPDRPEVWAGPWRPAPGVPQTGAVAAPETVWGALDCPSTMALWTSVAGTQLLGTITARQDLAVPVGEEHVIMTWVLDREGRRCTMASALVGPEGAIAALAQTVWITVG